MRFQSVIERNIRWFMLAGRGWRGWIGLVALVAAVAFGFAIVPAIWEWYKAPPAERIVPLSELVEIIKDGRAASIEIRSDDIHLRTTDNVKLRAAIPKMESGLATLLSLGVAPDRVLRAKMEFSGDGNFDWIWSIAPLVFLGLMWGGIFWSRTRESPTEDSESRRREAFVANRARRIQPDTLDVGWDDVAGVSKAKAALERLADEVREGAKPRRRILLHGPPGTGKTLLVRAFATAIKAQASFFTISGPEFVELYSGVGAARMRSLFAELRSEALPILFIDEVDAIGRKRDISGLHWSDERDAALNQLLVLMDGFDQSDNIILIAATNIKGVLDEALVRRFTQQIEAVLPNLDEREVLFATYERKAGLPVGWDLAARREFAVATAGLNGSDVAVVVQEAERTARARKAAQIEVGDVDEALEQRGRVIARPPPPPILIAALEHRVLGQRETVRRVANAVVDHYRALARAEPSQGQRQRFDMLIAGPPGCGKTLLIEQLAEQVKAPLIKVEAAALARNPDALGAAIVAKLAGGQRLAREIQSAIILIQGGESLTQAAARGAEQEIGRLLDGSVIDVARYRSSTAEAIVGTSNMLYILEATLAAEGATPPQAQGRERSREGLHQVLVRKGYDRTLVNRFPLVLQMAPLNAVVLRKILADADASLFGRIRSRFAERGVTLNLAPDLADGIAQEALRLGGDARALNGLLEDLLDRLYLPETAHADAPVEIMLTGDMATGLWR